MKKSYIITGITALTILVAAAGATSTALASGKNGGLGNMLGKFKGQIAKDLTDAQKTEIKTKQDAVKAALDANNYTAWVNAVKAANVNSPLLKKITADNFSRYIEAHKLRTQANTIMTELDLNNGEQGRFGLGGGPGEMFGGGHGEGMQK